MPIVGKTFGSLTVVALAAHYVRPSNGKREKRYLCSCICGGETVTSKRKLEIGHTTSCGCALVKHGRSKEPEYNTWNLIQQRCYNPSFTKYQNYGARGIQVCPQWRDDVTGYSTFLKDMGLRPSTKHTIERKDVDGSYCPENCVWTDDTSLQAYNQTIRANNSSGKTGVAFDTSKNKWVATLSKKPVSLKRQFDSFEDACKQRDCWEIQHYGFNKK